MKKRMIILMTSLIFTFTATYAKTSDTKVPESVTSEFNSDFSQASNVQWEKIADYFKVSFNQHGVVLYAFYTDDADFMGIANYMLSDKLPVSLKSEIKKNYPGYWITDLIKYSIKDKPGYYVALENANQKIMLKTDRNENWYVYKTIAKS